VDAGKVALSLVPFCAPWISRKKKKGGGGKGKGKDGLVPLPTLSSTIIVPVSKGGGPPFSKPAFRIIGRGRGGKEEEISGHLMLCFAQYIQREKGSADGGKGEREKRGGLDASRIGPADHRVVMWKMSN